MSKAHVIKVTETIGIDAHDKNKRRILIIEIGLLARSMFLKHVLPNAWRISHTRTHISTSAVAQRRSRSRNGSSTQLREHAACSSTVIAEAIITRACPAQHWLGNLALSARSTAGSSSSFDRGGAATQCHTQCCVRLTHDRMYWCRYGILWHGESKRLSEFRPCAGHLCRCR